MKKVLLGSHAVSYGVQLCRAQVVSAYPITPQTHIVEELSEMCRDGRLNARFIKVESEHSAMACILGAASAGARVFTATSSHGLALMHEVLHWAAGSRLPIVLANVNRAIGPPWSIMPDQGDSLAQRDTGWIQLFTESGQEAMDTIIQAYKIAEEVLLPVMVNLDGFFLSHTSRSGGPARTGRCGRVFASFRSAVQAGHGRSEDVRGPVRGRSVRGVSIRHAKGHGPSSRDHRRDGTRPSGRPLKGGIPGPAGSVQAGRGRDGRWSRRGRSPDRPGWQWIACGTGGRLWAC